MSDELAEIDGIKPKVLLREGDQKELGSKSSKAVYKIKRTFDHFYCTCPAWRNQSGTPVNARTCKHIKELLGDKYEEARIRLKNPDGASGSDKAKTAKRKKAEEDDEEEDEDEKPAKKTNRKPTSKAKDQGTEPTKKAPASKGKSKATVPAPAEEEEGKGNEKPAKKTNRKPASKVKDQGAEPAKKAPASKGKSKTAVSAPTKEDEEEDEDEKPAKTDRKPASKVKDQDTAKKVPASKGKSKIAVPAPIKEDQAEDEKMADGADGGDKDPSDDLASINGIKPNVYLDMGEEKEVRSMTSNATYKVKRTFDDYYCTCPAWRNQGGVPVNARSCKHLKELLGDKYEAARMKLKNPYGATSSKKTAGKRKKTDFDDDDDDRKVKKKAKKADEEDDDEEEEVGATGKKVPELLLAVKWDLVTGADPTGWWISEKLDGVRCYYDGKSMISRLGNPFTPPQWFLDKLPKDVTLDGELFGGRREFQSTVSIVKSINHPQWKDITFQIFDVPSMGSEPFEERLAYLKKTFGPGGAYESNKVVIVAQEKADSRQHVLDKLKEIESLGGEGLMLREAGSKYHGSRSNTLLKIKTFYDAEAQVIGYLAGKGKNKGVTGSLTCRMESGKTFNVGTGLSDKLRQNPPKVGAIIVYRFQELTKDGVPRFPSYVGEAADKTKPKDAEVPEHKKV